MRRLLFGLLVVLSGTVGAAQEVPLEYRVKAAFLYNFVKYVEWPDPQKDQVLICVAGQNPFGTVLEDLVENERIRGKVLKTTVILEPTPECDVVFTPKTSSMSAYLRAASGMPTLTVGETKGYLEQGGVINFIVEGISVRFEISRAAAARARLRISSRLLQLARNVEPETEER